MCLHLSDENKRNIDRLGLLENFLRIPSSKREVLLCKAYHSLNLRPLIRLFFKKKKKLVIYLYGLL